MMVDARALARAAFQRGDKRAALKLLLDHCNAEGDERDWLDLASLRRQLGDGEGAHKAIERAYELAPTAAHVARAMAQHLLYGGAASAARAVLDAAHQQNTADTELATDLAIACEICGDRESAAALYDDVIRAAPGALRARQNRAADAYDRGDHAAALGDYDALLTHRPNMVAALLGRAECLRRLGRYDESVSACRAVIDLEATNIPARLCQAVALAAAAEFNAAQALLDDVWQRDRDAVMAYAGVADAQSTAPDARALFVMAEYQNLQVAEWGGFDAIAGRCERIFADADSAPNELDLAYAVLSLPIANRAASNAHAAISARLARPAARAVARLTSRERIRVAYISTKFREHPVMLLTSGLYQAHDHERFELFAYALNADDRGPTRRQIAAEFDAFVELPGADDAEIIARLRADDIDILVDLDGYSDDARVAVMAARPARLQVAYLGHLYSQFAPWIDYRITCKRSEPLDWGRPLVERRVFMSESFFPYPAAAVADVPTPSRAALGLPEDAFVICAFGRVNKICPAVFTIWMDLLDVLPDAILWLKDCPGPVRKRLLRRVESHGIAGNRLIFAPDVEYAQHLVRQRCADLYLDTFKYNAHTTALDALHAGLPLVTCRGESWGARVGASLLGALELDELVTGSPSDYAALAVELARNRPRLAALKARLAARMARDDPFAPGRIAAELGEAFEIMWSRYTARVPAQDIHVATTPGWKGRRGA